MTRARVRLIVIAAAILGMAACGVPAPPGVARGAEAPARVSRVAGTDLVRVVLTAAAARRVGIATAPVRLLPTPALASSPGLAPEVGVPASAVIYDRRGASWVYVVTGPLSYVRRSVSIVRLVDDVAVLRPGPAPGATVVTVGAAELLGAEDGAAGE